MVVTAKILMGYAVARSSSVPTFAFLRQAPVLKNAPGDKKNQNIKRRFYYNIVTNCLDKIFNSLEHTLAFNLTVEPRLLPHADGQVRARDFFSGQKIVFGVGGLIPGEGSRQHDLPTQKGVFHICLI